jgi:hypothetical protein
MVIELANDEWARPTRSASGSGPLVGFRSRALTTVLHGQGPGSAIVTAR